LSTLSTRRGTGGIQQRFGLYVSEGRMRRTHGRCSCSSTFDPWHGHGSDRGQRGRTSARLQRISGYPELWTMLSTHLAGRNPPVRHSHATSSTASSPVQTGSCRRCETAREPPSVRCRSLLQTPCQARSTCSLFPDPVRLHRRYRLVFRGTVSLRPVRARRGCRDVGCASPTGSKP
jgi:hypothetical protein